LHLEPITRGEEVRTLRWLVSVVVPILLAPDPLAGQVPLVLTGSMGATFDIGDNGPASGGGFSYHTGIGLRLSRLTLGAEFGQHGLGDDRKAKQYGAFLRFPAMTAGRARPYLVVGVADYRFTPVPAGRTHSLGGSVGPGVLVALASRRVHLVLEARFHTSFDQIGTLSSQEFLGVSAGLGVSL
jgi:hypothetical protein